MQLLVFLHRFDMDRSLVVRKISSLGDVKIVDEDGVLFVDGKIKVKEVKDLVEVEKVLEVVSVWKPFSYGALEDVAKLLPGRKYKIIVKLTGVLDLSSKSIYKRINSVRSGYDEKDYLNIIYVEVIKKGGIKHFRVSYISREDWEKKVEKFDYPFLVVLENPTLVSEVADFLRVCYVFKVPLMLVGDIDFGIIEKARENTKNVPREFKVLVSKSLPKNCFGFSKHALKGEKELVKNFKKVKGEFALVFGNEKFGLSQKAREGCELFRLGSEINKPLRGSHALSFVLGLYRSV